MLLRSLTCTKPGNVLAPGCDLQEDAALMHPPFQLISPQLCDMQVVLQSCNCLTDVAKWRLQGQQHMS